MPAIVTAMPSTDTVTTRLARCSITSPWAWGSTIWSTSHTGSRVSTVSPHVPAGPGGGCRWRGRAGLRSDMNTVSWTTAPDCSAISST